MKILADSLAQFDATIAEGRDAWRIITKSGTPFGGFSRPADPAAFTPLGPDNKLQPTGLAVVHALTALVELDATVLAVNSDNRLSEIGRIEKLAEPRDRAIKTLLGAHRMVADNAKGLDALESQRYALPPYDKTDLAGELRAREIREFIRSLNTPTDRESIIEQLKTGEDTDMLRAVLRSPINMGNIERTANLGWRNRIDRIDPAGLAFLDLGRQSANWAERILLQTQTLMKPRHNFNPRQLFDRVGNDGASFFGISAESVLAYEREMMARNAA